MSGGPTCHSPENKQSAVQLLSQRIVRCATVDTQSMSSWDGASVSAVPRPLPGAFPNRRTVFFFDWDDTLCPTSWIRSILTAHIADLKEWCDLEQLDNEVEWRDSVPGWFSQPLPDEPTVHEWIADLQRAVIDVITACQAYGVVCIVTNALPGWVDKTIKKWLPMLTQYIYGHGARPPIKVLYGQQAYKPPQGAAADLSWVNELGPYMWWKKAAMTKALDGVDELYRLEETNFSPRHGSAQILPNISWCGCGDQKRVASVISVGDDEAEMQATELAARDYDERRVALHAGRSSRRVYHNVASGTCRWSSGSTKWPWIKLVKCKERPHVKQLQTQLQEILELLPELVAQRQHFRIPMDPAQDEHSQRDAHDPLAPPSPRSRSELCTKFFGADATTEKRCAEWTLRMQTV